MQAWAGENTKGEAYQMRRRGLLMPGRPERAATKESTDTATSRSHSLTPTQIYVEVQGEVAVEVDEEEVVEIQGDIEMEGSRQRKR